jgi:Fic family protein
MLAASRVLLRSESAASSYIEGLRIGPRSLLRAVAGVEPVSDRVSSQVLANVAAMEDALALGTTGRDLDLPDLLAVHARLTRGTLPDAHVGVLRTQQNWIGGSAHNPCRAAFVPSPPEHVPALMDDLVAYINADQHSPLVQAAIAHAQFETIHPFVDGNGRVGRALIQMILRRRRLAPNVVPPVSLLLAADTRSYIGALTSYRHVGLPDEPLRSTGCHEWLHTFAAATHAASDRGLEHIGRARQLGDQWHERLAPVRANSAAEALITALRGMPIVTVETAAQLIDRSTVRTAEAINRFVEAGILVQRNPGRQRGRVFEAKNAIDLIAELDASLREPARS